MALEDTQQRGDPQGPGRPGGRRDGTRWRGQLREQAARPTCATSRSAPIRTARATARWISAAGSPRPSACASTPRGKTPTPTCEHADGRRNFYALAADWQISDKATLELDSDYQTSSQRSVSGYQLLGGTRDPRASQHLAHARFRAVAAAGRHPGHQHAARASTTLQRRLEPAPGRPATAARVIDDNVAFAYGCFYSPDCASGATPGYFFAPNGDYDVYDYRSPDDTRVRRRGPRRARRAASTPAASATNSASAPARSAAPSTAPLRLRLRRHRQYRPGRSALFRPFAEPARRIGAPR